MLGQWHEAADAFAKATVTADYAWRPQFQWALLQLAAGDEEGYRATCDDLLKRHGDNPTSAAAYAIVLTCIAGERSVEDFNKVMQIAERMAATDARNPGFQSLLGAAEFRAGRTQEAIERLKKSVPLHSFAALAVPKQRQQIHVSWLTGETILALAYHEANDEAALGRQLDALRNLVQKCEATNPQYSEDIGEWALPLAILMAKRQLTRLASP
jgi:hypothetical protein